MEGEKAGGTIREDVRAGRLITFAMARNCSISSRNTQHELCVCRKAVAGSKQNLLSDLFTWKSMQMKQIIVLVLLPLERHIFTQNDRPASFYVFAEL